jgi:protein-disulfide isomerase
MNEKEQRKVEAQNKAWYKKLMIYGGLGLVVLGFVWSIFYSQGVKDDRKAMAVDLVKIVSDDYVKGNPNASVTLIEYLDFECEACGAYYPIIKQLKADMPDDVRVVNRYFPLPGHRNGMTAALAVEAAGRQGKYFEMHDLVFERQKEWGEKQIPTPDVFEKYAQELKLDITKFKADVNSDSVKQRVERDIDSGKKLGNTGTPSFYLNGTKLNSPGSLESFKQIILNEKAKVLKENN